MLPCMKIGEWDNLGRARGLLQHQLGELGADEYAAHVAVNPDTGRLRIMIATDVGLLDYSYAPIGSDPLGTWILRGQVHRWVSVRGLRLQTDAQLDNETEQVQEVWRLVAEEPKIELSVTSETGDESIEGLLGFARACMQHTR
jgi:hypothetical protein